jgi:L-2,4-diaminobutyrate decarboxylase
VQPEVWQHGTPRQLALMVSEQAHYCVDRAARIMGWGSAGIIKIPTNDRYQMRTDLLEAYYQDATERGVEIIAVVGSACTTSTGSFDDLTAIADFCEDRDLWFHVDGAHGAALIYAEQYRERVAGIERADSVIMDFHKMLLTPSITTALVFKDGKQNFSTFAQEAQYLFEEQGGLDWYNMAKRTFECTKTMMSLKVYSILQAHGTKLFDQYVSRVVKLGEQLSRLVKEHPQFELAMEAQCNIVCFRHRPPGVPREQLSRHNEELRRKMKENGRFYIVKTKLRDETYLRCTLTNPFTDLSHLAAMLLEVEKVASLSGANI